ncbi:MAG: outer membrane protein assembly factor BamD [Candidatus Brocadiia bacterium]|jgi:outer membrane protein assembly factor BamD (BamD/ComL family)
MREQVRSFTPIVVRRASRACAVLALVTALMLAGAAQAEWVWDGDLGWIDMSERPTESDRGLFAYATGLLIRGDYAAAADVFRRVEEKFPESPFAIKARFGRAKCAFHLDKPAEAAKLCDELLAAKPESLRRDDLEAFIRDLAAKLGQSDPKRAAELLNRLGTSRPTEKTQSEAVTEPAAPARNPGDDRTAGAASEKIAAPASDPEARYDAMFKEAVNDVDESRDREHSEMLLRQAEAKLRELLSADPKGRHEKEAREYLDVINGLLKESDPERRAVYYAVTRLLEPGYGGDSTVFKSAAKQFRGSSVGETARFYQAECLYRQGELWSAFDVYEQFLQEYAASSRRRAVVEREYVIGQALQDQHQLSRAEDVMEAVAHNASNGPLADDALMSVGRAQLDRERFEDARTTFDLVAQGYPKSKWNRAAIFMSGVADLRHSRVIPDNEMLLERAQRAFEIYLRDQPNGQFADEAKNLLRECKEKEAQTLLDVAHFYEKRDKPAAAAVYYKMVLAEYPESVSAESAKSALGQPDEPSKKANP